MTRLIADTHQVITIKKTPLDYTAGNYPPGVGLQKNWRRIKCNDKNQGHYIRGVAIAVLDTDGEKFAQYRLSCDLMSIPGRLCWFYVEYQYPWRIKTGATDYDRILTNGEVFYLVSRDLGKSLFILNDFTKSLIIEAIQEFVGEL